MEKSVEEKYKKLDDIEHVLLRPGMYVGSTKSREEDVFFLSVPEEGTEEGEAPPRAMSSRKVTYNPAFMKIFDEIISNAVDEHRRNPKLNEIRVLVDPTKGLVKIWDNGGIPVVKHAEYGEWVPELIFSNLKAGSNFDDTEDRLVAGTNGVGSTLTNIFSKEFRVRTSDGKSEFDQTFRNNMRDREPAKVTPKKSKSGFTEITFVPDLSRFSLAEIDPDHAGMMKKRCLDLAACNPKLKISYSSVGVNPSQETFSFPSFKDYCRMYIPAQGSLFYEESERWKVGVSPSDGSFTQVSYVNSVETKDGGSHIENVVWQIVSWLRERLKKKHKIDLKPQEIRNHIFLCVQADIVNPAFSSQTKEKLITEVRDFGSKWEPSEALLKQIFASEIIQRILDWAEQKALAEERRQLRDLNKLVGKEKILKLIDAKATAGRVRCSLALFEGDCLHEDTQILVFREGLGPTSMPLREVVVGDHVITHTNTLKEITAVSRKISRLHCIKTSRGEIWASGTHRLWVYTPSKDLFDFIPVSEIVPGTHRIVQNRLADTRRVLDLLSVSQDEKGFRIETSEGVLVATREHKFATLNVSSGVFGLTSSESLEVGTHVLVLSLAHPRTVGGL